MYPTTLFSILSVLALVVAAPHGTGYGKLHKRSNCAAKSSPPANIGVEALVTGQHVGNPATTGGLTSAPQGVAAWDQGGWGAWRDKQSSAPPPPPANQPTAPPASQSVMPLASQPVVPDVTQPVAPPVSSPPVSLPPVSSPPASAPPVSVHPIASQSVPAGPVSSTAPSVGGASAGGTGPVGLGLDDTSWAQLADAPGLNWYWNWCMTPFQMGSVEYVGNIWGQVMADAFTGEIPAGMKYVMSFNEPDMGPDVGGSNIPSPATAASLHQAWTAKLTSDVQVGAIAVARGGDVKYFQPWLDACAGNCKFDFVPIHYYGTDANDLISYIKNFPAQGKPIWVTEFDCQDFGTGYVCTEEESAQFMQTAITWFRGEGASIVHRWAWFGAFPKFSDKSFGLLSAEGALNSHGTSYLGM